MPREQVSTMPRCWQMPIFFGQQHVQYFIARIGGPLVSSDGLLELIQLLLGHRAPEGFDQVL